MEGCGFTDVSNIQDKKNLGSCHVLGFAAFPGVRTTSASELGHTPSFTGAEWMTFFMPES